MALKMIFEGGDSRVLAYETYKRLSGSQFQNTSLRIWGDLSSLRNHTCSIPYEYRVYLHDSKKTLEKPQIDLEIVVVDNGQVNHPIKP